MSVPSKLSPNYGNCRSDPDKEKCLLCPQLLHPFDLLDHIRKVHPVHPDQRPKKTRSTGPPTTQRLTCDICKCAPMSKSMMLTHLSQTHSSSLRKEVLKICHVCDKSVECHAFNAHMDDHMRSITPLTKGKFWYNCLVCNGRFPFEHRLKNHLYKKHGYALGGVFECDICNHICMSKKKKHMQNHLEAVHLKVTRDCKICGKTVPKFSISGHIKRYHSNYPRERKLCILCGKTVCSQSTLNIHAYIHHQVMPEDHKDCACDICGSRFFIPNLLWTHVAAKHLGHTYYKWRRSNL